MKYKYIIKTVECFGTICYIGTGSFIIYINLNNKNIKIKR